MRKNFFAILMIVVMMTLSVSVMAQDISEKTYPSQFSTLEVYESETGNAIASFQEAPMLAERVDAGELSAVEERLPSEPAVVEPLDSIGTYGGELAGPSTNPTCCGWDMIEMRLQKLITIDTDLQTIIPNIAKSVEMSDDMMTYTITLREGHKWSDGEPFTTEDFRFWFEDILSNEDITPVPGGTWAPNGTLPTLEVIDETTVQYTFAAPHPSHMVGMAEEFGNRGFRPAHYFKQFHIDYNPDADALAAEQSQEGWVQLITAKEQPYSWTWNLGSETDAYAPTLGTYVYSSQDSVGNKIYERNPYFFKVDVAGNQLPYTDTLRRILVENLEAQNLKALAGEYTHHGWGTLLSFAAYRENEEAGGYRTATAQYSRGNEYALMFNFTNEDPVLQEIFWDVRFRQAMSVAIDRNEINELVYFGLATPSQAAPVPSSAFYEDWMSDHYAQYDTDMANQLLDEMGLDQRDDEGFRLRSDGETLFINMQVAVPEDAWRLIGELVADYWNAVGVKTNYKLIEDGLYSELRDGNAVTVAAWGYDTSDIGDYANRLNNTLPHWSARSSGLLWEDWLNTDGAEGMEPPQDIKDLWDLGQEFLAQPYGSESYLSIGKELFNKHFENLYVIGTIQRPPQPLLFSADLMNTPPNDTTAQWSWSYRQWVMFMPEQWYFGSGS